MGKERLEDGKEEEYEENEELGSEGSEVREEARGG